MTKSMVCVCSWCPEKDEISKLEKKAGNIITYGICEECSEVFIETINQIEKVYDL